MHIVSFGQGMPLGRCIAGCCGRYKYYRLVTSNAQYFAFATLNCRLSANGWFQFKWNKHCCHFLFEKSFCWILWASEHIHWAALKTQLCFKLKKSKLELLNFHEIYVNHASISWKECLQISCKNVYCASNGSSFCEAPQKLKFTD